MVDVTLSGITNLRNEHRQKQEKQETDTECQRTVGNETSDNKKLFLTRELNKKIMKKEY